MIPELKEINDMIQIEMVITEDFYVMSKMVKWCDSYSRWGRLHFDIVKDCKLYTVLLVCHPELHAYVKKMIVHSRFNDTLEFQKFVLQKLKKSNPQIDKYRE